MSAPRDPVQRLMDLEGILAQSKTVFVDTSDRNADPVAVHLAGVQTDRIRRLAGALHQGTAEENDDIDALTMRLLLTDYTIAVRHLRVVARAAGAQMDYASAVIREGQRRVAKEQKLEARRAAHGTDGLTTP